MKTKIFTLTLLLGMTFAACKGGSGGGKGQEAKKGATPTDDGTVPGGIPVSTDSDADPMGKDLQLLPLQGSSMSFLDSKALTIVYARVFAKKDYGYMHCATKKPTDVAACDDIFAPDERSTLGSFDIYNANLKRGTPNVNRVSSVSLNYIRSLRAGLSRECGNLVSTEYAAFKSGTFASNILIKAAAPTAATIESFFRKILDVENQASIVVDIDAAGYEADFPKSVALMPDATKAVTNAYLNLCIAVAMDPQVFLF